LDEARDGCRNKIIPDRWRFACKPEENARHRRRAHEDFGTIEMATLAELVWAGEVLGIDWVMEEAATVLASRLGEGACGSPPFPNLQWRILSIVLRSPDRLAVCARCVSGLPELQDLAASLARLAGSGHCARNVVAIQSCWFGTPEAAGMLRLLFQFGLLMQDLQISGAEALRMNTLRTLSKVTIVRDAAVGSDLALWATLDPDEEVRRAALDSLVQLTSGRGLIWEQRMPDCGSGRLYCTVCLALWQHCPTYYPQEDSEVRSGLASLNLLAASRACCWYHLRIAEALETLGVGDTEGAADS